MARGLCGLRQRRAHHAGVGTAGNGLGEVASVGHSAVGDDIDVLTGLEHVLHAGTRGVGDCRRLGHADPDDLAGGARGARAHAHQHAHGAGAHEVQGRRVRRATAHDDRHGQVGDELLEVERLDR